ncbi:MAG: TolC family protein, partial [Alphaproteobacteria bacterium]
MAVLSCKRMVPVLVAGALSFATAGPVFAASLEEVLAALILDHPNIRAAYKTVESSREEIKRTTSDFYPQVSITGDVTQEVIDSPAERQAGDGQLGKPSTRTAERGSISVIQNLFSGFLTTSSVRTAQLNRELARMTLEGTRQNIVFEGINAYVNVLKQKRLIELSRENEATIQQQLNL